MPKRAPWLALVNLSLAMLLSGCLGGGGEAKKKAKEAGNILQDQKDPGPDNAQLDVNATLLKNPPELVEESAGGNIRRRDQRAVTPGSGQGGIQLDQPYGDPVPNTYIPPGAQYSQPLRSEPIIRDHRNDPGPDQLTSPWPAGTKFRNVQGPDGRIYQQTQKPGETWWTAPDGTIVPY